MGKRTLQYYLDRFKETHGSAYDYSLFSSADNPSSINIICKKHGVFKQSAWSHFQGQGCPACGKERAKKSNSFTTTKFIKKAREIHGHRYDYSKSKWAGCKQDIVITCKRHGDFLQKGSRHIGGANCMKCVIEGRGHLKRGDFKYFLKAAASLHGDKYIYHKSDFVKMSDKTRITCKVHGDFSQTPTKHINGKGCAKCNTSKGEREIARVLDYLGIQYEQQKTFDNCRNIKVLPFDFFLPDYNTLIEYQGEQHYKRVERFAKKTSLLKRQKLDDIKAEFALSNNFKLLHIPFFCDKIQVRLESFLYNFCGRNFSKSIDTIILIQAYPMGVFDVSTTRGRNDVISKRLKAHELFKELKETCKKENAFIKIEWVNPHSQYEENVYYVYEFITQFSYGYEILNKDISEIEIIKGFGEWTNAK